MSAYSEWISGCISDSEYKQACRKEDDRAAIEREMYIDACIKRLDEYIQERPDYKSKDHNLCIRRWVIKAVQESQEKPSMKVTPFHNFDMKHDYDFDAMETELLRR